MTTLKYGWIPDVRDAMDDVRKALIEAGYLRADDRTGNGLLTAITLLVNHNGLDCQRAARDYLLSVVGSNTHPVAERMHAAALLLQVKP